MPPLIQRLKRAVRHVIGTDDLKSNPADSVDMEAGFREIWETCRPFTMTSMARGYAIFKAAEHITKVRVPGDLAECGVWKGGSAMLMALSMRHFGDASRRIHLFDTFTGMTAPGVFDRSAAGGRPALERWESNRRSDGGNDWARAPLEEVRKNLSLTGYPVDRLVMHVGNVSETVPPLLVSGIAMLRLDTDFYESTKIELEHLYPKVSRGGFVIIDDYGHFLGARKAVDEYFASVPAAPFLHRLDYTGRLIQIP